MLERASRIAPARMKLAASDSGSHIITARHGQRYRVRDSDGLLLARIVR
jgi:hypothetical protein